MTRLPAPPSEVPVTRSLDGLAPKFRAAVERVLDRMRADGFDPIVSKSRLWSADPSFWVSLGVASHKEGLIWGADWNNNGRTDDERFVDRPHIQWGNGMRRSPSSRAVALQASGGNAAVWAAVGAASEVADAA